MGGSQSIAPFSIVPVYGGGKDAAALRQEAGGRRKAEMWKHFGSDWNTSDSRAGQPNVLQPP